MVSPPYRRKRRLLELSLVRNDDGSESLLEVRDDTGAALDNSVLGVSSGGSTVTLTDNEDGTVTISDTDDFTVMVSAVVVDHLSKRVSTFGGGEEGFSAVATSGSTFAVNLTNANVLELTLNQNVTITLPATTNNKACSLSLYLIQDGTGGRTITWPSSVKWAGGSPPVLTAVAGSVDLVVLETVNGGTLWRGNLSGLDYK